MKVVFRLRTPSSPNSGIELDFSNKVFKNRRFKYGTSEVIPTKHWNQRTMRANIGKSSGSLYQSLINTNRKLDSLEIKLLNYMREYPATTAKTLKEHLEDETGVTELKVQKEKNNEEELFAFLDNMISDNSDLKPNTIKGKRQTVNTLKSFQKDKKIDVNFETFDFLIFKKFKRYLTKDRDFRPNTVWKHVKDLKALMREAEKNKRTVHPDYRLGDFTAKEVETEKISLTDAEIDSLIDLNLGSSGLGRSRDLFVIGALTGLRYSDFSTLKKEDIVHENDGDYIVKRQVKTSRIVKIPIASKVKAILNKYDGSPPPTVAPQVMNRNIKRICEVAGIDHADLVTTHTARRSFATNAYRDEENIPIIDIMMITGHKTEVEFLKYIVISPEEHAMRLARKYKRFS